MASPFAPLICPKLPQDCKAERLSLACGGAQCHMENPEVRQTRRLGLGWDRNGVWGGTGLPAAPKHTKGTGGSTSTRSDSAPENIHRVYFCRFDQKAKTKPEGRHGWKEKRDDLYFKQVFNPGSYTACFITYQKTHHNPQKNPTA